MVRPFPARSKSLVMKRHIALAALLTLTSTGLAEDPAGTFRVYVLAGQSNMEGKAQNVLLEHQAVDEKTRDQFAHLRDGDGWIVRDDVAVKFLGRHGGLTIGYGSPDRTGVELEFGTVMGDAHDEPVLLIKTCWGGHSLYKLFRSPSSGLPEELLAADLEGQIKRVRNANEKNGKDDPLPTLEDIKQGYGRSYRNMLAEVAATLASKDELFPSLKGKQPELAGFVWFQGWNDMYNGAETEYASNMRHFIQDVRRDLGAPDLPFVIGLMGQNMSKPAKGPMLVIQQAQLSMETLPEFKGNVKAVRTDVLVDEAAEALYPSWKDRFEEWQKTGSDHPYHYLGSALWFNRMGRAFGEAMLELEG